MVLLCFIFYSFVISSTFFHHSSQGSYPCRPLLTPVRSSEVIKHYVQRLCSRSIVLHVCSIGGSSQPLYQQLPAAGQQGCTWEWLKTYQQQHMMFSLNQFPQLCVTKSEFMLHLQPPQKIQTPPFKVYNFEIRQERSCLSKICNQRELTFQYTHCTLTNFCSSCIGLITAIQVMTRLVLVFLWYYFCHWKVCRKQTTHARILPSISASEHQK